MSTMDPIRPDFPHLITPLPGPKAQAIIDRDSAVLSPSYTRCYPLVVSAAKARWSKMLMATAFSTCNAGIAVVATGHCHPQGGGGDSASRPAS